MKLTVLLLAFLVSAALALPHYKRRGGMRPKQGDDPDQARVDSCRQMVEKCGRKEGDEETYERKNSYRQLNHLLRELKEDQAKEDCKSLVGEILQEDVEKRAVTMEDAEEVLKEVEEKCKCPPPPPRSGEKPESGPKERLLRLLSQGEEEKEDKQHECEEALQKAGIDVSKDPEGDDEDETNNPPPQKDEEELKELLRRLLTERK